MQLELHVTVLCCHGSLPFINAAIKFYIFRCYLKIPSRRTKYITKEVTD